MIEVKKNELKTDGKEFVRQYGELVRQCGEKWERFCELQGMRRKLRQQIGHSRKDHQAFYKLMFDVVEKKIKTVRQEEAVIFQQIREIQGCN